jgi:molybdopterin molybdotransferase
MVNGEIEVQKFPLEGAGLLTSLTRTTGLVVLPPDVVAVRPGMRVDYLPYAVLLD